MLLQVHDELVFEAPPGELDYVSSLVKQEMQHAAELSVPLVVESGNWEQLARNETVNGVRQDNIGNVLSRR